jgi:hypothetical protein
MAEARFAVPAPRLRICKLRRLRAKFVSPNLFLTR